MYVEIPQAAGPAALPEPPDRLATLNALAAAMAAAPDDDAVVGLAMRAAHVLADAPQAWLWLAGQALEARHLRAELAEARREAHTDALTGLWNRRHARAVLEREAAVAARVGRPFAALVVDVDRFKALNDVHGHDAGDRALAHVAALLAEGARGSDLVARWGGEEFVVICPGTDAEQAAALAERLRRMVAEAPAPIGPDLASPITVSIGVAAWRPADGSPEAVISRADRALYAAKAAGRDQVRAASPALI